MAILNILKYPDPRLHTVAKPVAEVNDNIRQIIADMRDTMYASKGIGLAATQVNIHQQIVVMDLSEERNQLQVFINAKITEKSGEQVYEEGCLSVPGVFDKVKRAAEITVEAWDENGKPFTLNADGLLAVCIQHELDHLQGKVFVEYLSRLKQNRIVAKMKKLAREQED
ncbi:MAG: peptide deformylase [Neisseriaceae bacterium]|nr:peptide deformylase [Neisseriaceae bacterium]MBQ9725180.1 peptide deformylase [Neisseriaceae bacterium]